MSAGSNLQGGGGQTLEQRVANIEAALRGGPPVIDALGVPTDDDVDLGSALNAWRDVFANGLVVGGARVDVAGLATATGVYVFDANDAAFVWPANRTTALILLWSAGGGGGGGGGGGVAPFPDVPAGESGGDRRPRGRFHRHHRRYDVFQRRDSWRRGRHAGAGSSGNVVPLKLTLPQCRAPLAVAGGADTSELYRGEGGTQSRHVLKYFFHSGLSEGDTISIVVPLGGDGGLGGRGER